MADESEHEKIQLFLNAVDEAIRQGQADLARNKLQSIKSTPMPRFALATLASQCRRVGLLNQALKILYPIVRSEVPIHPPPRANELAAYAAVLTAMGAYREAHILLDGLNGKDIPEVTLFQSFNHIRQWDYRSAIPLLKLYFEHPRIDAYQKLVAQVNLAAALIAEMQLDEAADLLNEILPLMLEKKLRLLYGNSLELATQIYIYRRDFQAAEQSIAKSAEILSSSRAWDLRNVHKWNSILKLVRGDTDALISLNEVRDQALTARNWETVRDCDFYTAVISDNEALLTYVAFGTPLVGYHRRMSIIRGKFLNLPDEFDWQPGAVQPDKPNRNFKIFDVGLGREIDGSRELKFGGILQVCLKSLCLDFYRPLSMGAVFPHLWPEEKFNPFTSPERIMRVIKRLRRWFEENDIPLTIAISAREFRLQALQPYLLRVQLDKLRPSLHEHRIDLLKAEWPYKSFSSRQIEEKFGASFKRTAQQAYKEGKIFRSGSGRSTTYRFRK